jgi:hypothetical protein
VLRCDGSPRRDDANREASQVIGGECVFCGDAVQVDVCDCRQRQVVNRGTDETDAPASAPARTATGCPGESPLPCGSILLVVGVVNGVN